MRLISLTVMMTLFLVGGVLSAPAQAVSILDTGHSNSPSVFLSPVGFKGFAAEFSTSQDLTITDISGYMRDHNASSNSLTAAICTDGGNVPGAVYNGYSDTFSVPAGVTGQPGPAGWYGLTGLTWSLPAGTYWAVIEGSPGVTSYWDTYTQGASPGPFPNRNAYLLSGWSASPSASYDFAWRINANPNPVPIPGAILLLGPGLAGLVALRRRFKK
jgi:hypothetical protein